MLKIRCFILLVIVFLLESKFLISMEMQNNQKTLSIAINNSANNSKDDSKKKIEKKAIKLLNKPAQIILIKAICTKDDYLRENTFKYLLKKLKYRELLGQIINTANIVPTEWINNNLIEGSLTPLCYATAKGYEKIVELLLKYNADPNNTNSSFQQSALHMAVAFKHINIIKLLLKHKANPKIKNQYSETPISISKKHISNNNKLNNNKEHTENYQTIFDLLNKNKQQKKSSDEQFNIDL